MIYRENVDAVQKNDTYQYIFKLILIGDANIGKTSLINRYINRSFSDKYICTIGVDFMMKSIIYDNNRIKLQIWDTAGMEKYKQITVSYYRGAQAAIVCFDLTNKKSFKSVKRWIDDFSQTESMENKVIVLVGNKCDLTLEREVSKEEIQNFVELNKYYYFECSAKQGDNIDEMFCFLAQKLYDDNKNNKYNHRTTKLVDMEKYKNVLDKNNKKCSC
jgi:small GTP-binding protein